MAKKVLLTDYVWSSVEPERAVLAKAGAELVVSPDANEDTFVALAKDVDGIMVHERLRHRCTSLDEELRTLVVVAFGSELERRCAPRVHVRPGSE